MRRRSGRLEGADEPSVVPARATPDVLGMLVTQARITIEGVEALAALGQRRCRRRATTCADASTRPTTPSGPCASRCGTPSPPRSTPRTSTRSPSGSTRCSTGPRTWCARPRSWRPTPDRGDGRPWPRRSRPASGTWPGRSRCSAPTTHGSSQQATDEADAGVKQARRLEHTYRAAMSATLDLEDIRELAARRELYRRFTHLGDLLAQIGDRVWYAVMKES